MVKKIAFIAMFAAMLSASALSLRQLRAAESPAACGSPCTKSAGCLKPCLCFVVGTTTGVCQPEGPPPPPPELIRK